MSYESPFTSPTPLRASMIGFTFVGVLTVDVRGLDSILTFQVSDL